MSNCKRALNPTIRKELTGLLGGQVVFDEPMSRHTYFKVGGAADAFAAPENLATVKKLLQYCLTRGMPYRIIGDGTNLLVRDAGIRGVVVVLTRGLQAIEPFGEADAGRLITAMAGARMQALCRYAQSKGLGGMNFAVGIPGTVGGGLIMNAGTSLGAMADVVHAITVFDPNGGTRNIYRDQLRFGYRRLSWPGFEDADPYHCPVVLGGVVRLHRANPDQLASEARALRDARHRAQPLNQPSAGSFFKNPETGRTAGELIDRSGLKGTRVGGAQISTKHANFIVNSGGATAADILNLAQIVKNTVANKFSIELEFEVKVVGHETNAKKSA